MDTDKCAVHAVKDGKATGPALFEGSQAEGSAFIRDRSRNGGRDVSDLAMLSVPQSAELVQAESGEKPHKGKKKD